MAVFSLTGYPRAAELTGEELALESRALWK